CARGFRGRAATPSRFERLKIVKPPALPGDSYWPRHRRTLLRNRLRSLSGWTVERFRPSDHHLILAAVPPPDRHPRVRIGWIVSAVVIMKCHYHLAAFFH